MRLARRDADYVRCVQSKPEERKPGPDERESERDPGCARRSKMDRKKEIVEEAGHEGERILPRCGRKETARAKAERASEVGREFISPVSHLEPSAARLKFHLGRADVIKTNYAYGTVMPHHFIP